MLLRFEPFDLALLRVSTWLNPALFELELVGLIIRIILFLSILLFLFLSILLFLFFFIVLCLLAGTRLD